MLTLIYFCIVLGLLVCVHEFGHFAAAKICGVYVDRFSIGMGPGILKYKGKETTYVIACIPLGGYVQMAGQCDLPDEEQAALYKDVDKSRFYTEKSVWQRLFIILAGPGMNLVFALPLALALLVMGEQRMIMPNGPVVESVIEGSPAEKAGIVKGDRIASLNGEKVTAWESFVEDIRGSLYKEVTIGLADAFGQERTVKAVPEFNEAKKYLGLGVAVSPLAQVEKIEGSQPDLREGDVILGIKGLAEDKASFLALTETIRSYPGTNLTLTVRQCAKRMLLGSENGEGPERTVSMSIGARKKCRDFEALEMEGQWRLILRPCADPALAPLEGARILALNGRALEGQGVDFESLPEGPLSLSVAQAMAKEGGLARDTVVTTLYSQVAMMGHAGVLLKPAYANVCLPFGEALKKAPAKAWSKVDETVKTLKLLFTGSLKVNNLSGPVGIARMTGQAASRGFSVLLSFVLLITVNLGIINLLPLPVLDGGHVVLLIAEGIRRKPLPEKFLLWYQKLGLLLLLALFVMVMWNDIARWIADSELMGTLLGKIGK